MKIKKLLLLTVLLTPALSHAFGFDIEIGPIKVKHNAHKAKVKINTNKPIEKAVKATVNVAKAATRTVEATARAVVGDNKGSKKAFKKAEKNVKNAARNVTDTVKEIRDLTYHTAIVLPVATGELAVHETRDLSFELMTGEDPDEIKKEIERMLSQCKARTSELDDLNKYLRSEENFNRNGVHLDQALATGASGAALYTNPYTIGAMAVLYGLTAGIDKKMKKLKDQYESTVKVCLEMFNDKVEEINTLTNAQERKEHLRRNELLEKQKNILNSIAVKKEELNTLLKVRLEDYLGQSFTSTEAEEISEEYSFLIEEELKIFNDFVKNSQMQREDLESELASMSTNS